MQILPRPFTKTGELRGAGLDLNDSGMCWVELRKDTAQGLMLEHCIFEALAPGCIVNGQVLEFAEVEATLTRLLAGLDAAPVPRARSPLALAVPDSRVTTQFLGFPAKLNDAALAERLQADMAARLELSDDAICVDFVARPGGAVDPQAHAAKKELIAAAVPLEAVEDLLGLVEGAGLPWRVDVMALASQAAVSAALRAAQAKGGRLNAVMAIVQVGTGWLKLDVVQQGQVLHSEGFAIEPPHSSTSPEPHLVWPEGLQEALEAAYGSASAARPVQLCLTGPTEIAAAWAATLQERGLPCVLANPFESMVPGASLGRTHHADADRAMVACGLALMALSDTAPRKPAIQPPSFNFLPHRKTAFLLRKKTLLTQLGAVALCVLLASAALRLTLSEQLEAQQEAQAEVRENIAGLDAELKRLNGAQADTQRLQQHQDVLTRFVQKRQHASLMWQELSTLLPDGLHLNNLRQDGDGAVILTGQARSAAEVFGLIERLSAGSLHFKRPELLDMSLVAEAAALQALAPAISPAMSPPLSPALSPSAARVPTLAVQSAPPMPATAPVASSPAPLVERVVFTLRAQQP